MEFGLVERVIDAYLHGAFPMAEQGELCFFTCDPRFVFLFDQVHIPKRLARIARSSPFEILIDSDFPAVVEACRRGRPEWISAELVAVYVQLFERGLAHSIEAWQDGRLVGGVYGTHFGAAFMAESMFHTESNASGVCLVELLRRLKEGGFAFCDIQYPNEYTSRFRPVSWSKREFLHRYRKALEGRATLA
ncbi:MAG: leucyl/phenylalanyl-tRNA--protein transferase [Planctomycetes bacterium]|nr:leucyl/phenylalanyl-tRNA--protein transferase [Planctomycetota bacterium]